MGRKTRKSWEAEEGMTMEFFPVFPPLSRLPAHMLFFAALNSEDPSRVN
jgi:hypothetical protein